MTVSVKQDVKPHSYLLTLLTDQCPSVAGLWSSYRTALRPRIRMLTWVGRSAVIAQCTSVRRIAGTEQL